MVIFLVTLREFDDGTSWLQSSNCNCNANSEGRVRFPSHSEGRTCESTEQGCKDSNPVHECWRLAALPGAHPCIAVNRGYSAGVEPSAWRSTISRAAVTPRTPSPRPALDSG